MSFKDNVRTGRRRGDLCSELIASTWYGRNKAVFVRAFSQRSAEAGDVAGKVVFLHYRVRPNYFHQLIFFRRLGRGSEPAPAGYRKLLASRGWACPGAARVAYWHQPGKGQNRKNVAAGEQASSAFTNFRDFSRFFNDLAN
jgi:hypothetical protein